MSARVASIDWAESAMAAQGDREDKKLVIQRSQLRQHGEFWHVSVSERQKLRVPFLRTVLPPEVGESARAMASTARQKRSYLHHQGEFQLQNCTVGTVHDSDHEGVVRIFVGHSYHSNELFILYYIRLDYAAQFFLYQECNYSEFPPKCSYYSQRDSHYSQRDAHYSHQN